MIVELCLICHNAASSHTIENIHNKENVDFKLTIERIIKRRILKEKFQERQICSLCYKLVKEYETLEHELNKISETLFSKFQEFHPTKRGRKRKEDIEHKETKHAKEVEMEVDSKSDVKKENLDIPQQNEIVRKSGRKRKVKEIEIYIEPEKEFFESFDSPTKNVKILKDQQQILSSMATKCPHCDFAADSDVQVRILFSWFMRLFNLVDCNLQYFEIALKLWSQLLSAEKTCQI